MADHENEDNPVAPEDSAPFEQQEAPAISGSDRRDEESQKKGGGCVLGVLAVASVLLTLAALVAPNFIRARARGHLTACKSNLKNIGTAAEMYSTDWGGNYPERLEQLVPKYLKSIPDCPSAGRPTYFYQTGVDVGYNRPRFKDYYFMMCMGKHHTNVSVAEDYPQYDGISGLIER